MEGHWKEREVFFLQLHKQMADDSVGCSVRLYRVQPDKETKI